MNSWRYNRDFSNIYWHACPLYDDTYWMTICWLIDWTDTSLRYRHWRMCFERLLLAFARWQPGILFDIAAQPILEYRWIVSYSQPSLRTQFKVATVYSIHTQSMSWCSTGLIPNVLPEEMKARVSPVQSIEPHRILAPTRDSNQEPPGPQSRVVTTLLPLHTTILPLHTVIALPSHLTSNMSRCDVIYTEG